MWDSESMKQSPELSFDDDGRPVLITRAAPAYEEQHRQRVRKYLTLMSFRIPALVLAAIAYGIWHNGLISLAILVGSIPLPWIAVLIANDRPPRRPEEPRRYDNRRHSPEVSTAERPALEQHTVTPPQPDERGSNGDVPS
ncbi:hypothetical protein AU184_10865 [Mycolicibacterium novocastrense]|nr:hypothetical protein AU072_26995 [Mycolicibacterium novocastrense]KUH70590.1 hypothetical protein AU184_10865 [Mycolicibacterium novocastrense]KUH79028.1 hypothetical protein AU183_03415 [Mycolicibacterium novocastrense]